MKELNIKPSTIPSNKMINKKVIIKPEKKIKIFTIKTM